MPASPLFDQAPKDEVPATGGADANVSTEEIRDDERYCRQLEDRGLEVFFPYVEYDRGYGRGTRVEPFFPHYLFVHVDLMAPEASTLQWLIGVRGLVRIGEQPATLPDQVISHLRERLAPYQEKILAKSEWLFKSGEQVEITEGPFAGFEAVFQHGLSGGHRVQILLNMMGSWTRAQLGIEQIKPLAGD